MWDNLLAYIFTSKIDIWTVYFVKIHVAIHIVTGLYIACLLAAIQMSAGSTDLSSIEVRTGTVTYDPDGGDFYTRRITLKNTGKESINSLNDVVSLYVCFIRYLLTT